MLYALKKPLFLIPPELAHKLTIFGLKNNLIPYESIELPTCLNTKFFNYFLRSPVGLAAGFDKNGEVIKSIINMGFGFTEVGTITKKPQYGNKKPRVFRLYEDEAIINKLGFNNKGIKYLLNQINDRDLNTCVFGVNIGINSNTVDPITDYADLIRMTYGLSNYITINISSPNTKNLRDFQNKPKLTALLKGIMEARKSVDHAESLPILLKISPDIDDRTKENIASLALKYKVNGLIISNTTITRENLKNESGKVKCGGLSGKPIKQLSTQVLSDMYKLTKGKLVLIGCGGISSGADAYEKIKAGATVIQLYTALIYHGVKIVNKINLELIELLNRDGFTKVNNAVGIDHK